MGKNFSVEVRSDCLICGGSLPTPRYRTYCSPQCRGRRNYIKYKESSQEWARKRRGAYRADKLKCGVCGMWYVQVGSHIVQIHGMTAREYREEFNLPVKRGILKTEQRKFYGEQAVENGTIKNLKKGKRFWFKKGDKRAKTPRFWKSHRREPDELYE